MTKCSAELAVAIGEACMSKSYACFMSVPLRLFRILLVGMVLPDFLGAAGLTACTASAAQWRGVLQTSHHIPIEGATVSLRGEDVTTGPGGEFAVRGAPGEVSFSVGIRSPQADLELPEETVVTGTLELAGIVERNITLPATALISVAVTDSHGAGIPGVRVTGFASNATVPLELGPGFSAELETRYIEIPATDQEGRGITYSYPGVEFQEIAARYAVEGVSLEAATQDLHVVSGDNPVGLVFAQNQPIFWTGTLETATGHPISNATFFLETPDSQGSDTTNQNGEFKVGALPGSVRFSIGAPDDALHLPAITGVSGNLELDGPLAQNVRLPETVPLTITVATGGKPVSDSQVISTGRSPTTLPVELPSGQEAMLSAPYIEILETNGEGIGTTYSYPGIEYLGLLARAAGPPPFSAESSAFIVGPTGSTITITGGFAVNSVSPNSGPAGTVVEIAGSEFTKITSVKFGKKKAVSYTVNSSTSITAVVPPGKGTVSVTVAKKKKVKSVPGPADTFTYTA